MAKPMTTKDKIREWISDNLRYMLLIGAILLIVAAVLLIVHLVSPKNDGKSSGGTVTSSSTGNHVLYIVGVTRTVNVSIVTVSGRILNVRSIDGNTSFFFFRSVIDLIE